MTQPDDTNPFRRFWDLGYRNLVTVVPPGAELSEKSVLHKRLAAGDDSRGKVPGRRGGDGKWYGLKSWQHEATDPAFFDDWFRWGASCGLRTGDGLVAVDIDTLDKVAAKRIYEAALRILGPANPRVGNFPKLLMLYEISEDIPFRKIKFQTDTEASAHVELMTAGKQFVAAGTHPKTGKPYEWRGGAPARADLTKITPVQMDEFFAELADMFDGVSDVTSSGVDRETVDQSALRGDVAALRSAMNVLPNRQADFPSRESYLWPGIALKAALPDDEEDALDMYLQWCGRWDGGRNDVEVAIADFARFKPPFEFGAEFIYRKAEQLAGWTRPQELVRAQALEFFEPVEMEGVQADQPIRASTFQPLSVLQGVEVPDRDWVVPGLIPDKTVTMLSGDGGTGKSLIAQQLAAAAVLKKPWLGQEVKHGPVLLISAEDDQEELHRRFASILAHSGAAFRDMDDLVFRSLAGEDAVLGAVAGKTGLIRPTPLFQELEAEALRLRPVLIVLDTLADLFGGSEIDRVQVRQFVGILRGLAIRCECAALLLSHPSVSGMQSGSGTSGSTAWNASVRSRLYLERIVEDGVEPNPDARRLTTKKANYARTGDTIGLSWADGVFVVDETVAGVDRDGGAKAQSVFLQKLKEFADQGRFVSASYGPTYAPAVFAKSGAKGMTKKALSAAMEALLATGHIKVEKHGKAGRERSHLVLGNPFERIADASDGSDVTSGSEGVFD